MNKTAVVLLSLLLVLILGAGGYLAYQKYFAPNNTVPAQQVAQQPQKNVAKPGPGAAVKLSQNQVVGPVLTFSGENVAFLTPSGNLYKADLLADGAVLQLQNEQNLNVKPKPGVSKILWPLSGQDFIAQINTSTQTSWSYFNHNNSTYVDLPPQIESLDWMPSGDKILYIWLENGKATLNISNPDSNNWKKMADMWETDDQLHVSPDGLTVAYFETANNKPINPIYSTTPDGKVWKTLVSSGYNYGVLWSPDSKKFLFGKKDPVTGKYELWVYDILSGQAQDLLVATTPDKAVWSKDGSLVYAAVPEQIATGQSTSDTFVRITMGSFEQKPYNSAGAGIDAHDLFLTANGNDLLFKNTQDGYLYYMDISE